MDYLDKEMSIMGILSAVSVIAPGGILSSVLTSDKGVARAIWDSNGLFIVAGSALCIVAALWFYKQRSYLAWCYGQICFHEAMKERDLNGLRKWFEDADSWAMWWPYSVGFTFLIVGFAQYFFAIFTYVVCHIGFGSPAHVHITKVCFSWTCAALVTVVATLQWYVLTRYPYSDRYWVDFLSSLSGHRSEMRTKPHEGVFTRLQSSPIHGVGVFAIADIPKGQYVFEPDDSETVQVPIADTNDLAPKLRQLYEDFCVLKDDVYECPSNFNSLVPSWYLNSSSDPNMAADSSLKFYAIRDIREGEELTADYSTYSENESNSEMS